MSDTYICVNKFQKADIGDTATAYSSSNYDYKYVIYNYSIGLDAVIPEDVLNKYFIKIKNTYHIKFKTKTTLGFNKNKNYYIEFKSVSDDILELIYVKIISYIRRIELLDMTILNNFQSVIINMCDNLMVISNLEENFEDEFETLKTAINESEQIFKSMYETALNIMKEANVINNKLANPVLNEHRKIIGLYTEMFRDLNKI